MEMNKKSGTLMLREIVIGKIQRAILFRQSLKEDVVKGRIKEIVTNEDYIECFNDPEDYLNTISFILNAQANMDKNLELDSTVIGMLPGFYEVIRRSKKEFEYKDIYTKSLDAMLMHNNSDKDNYNEYIRFACLSFDLIMNKTLFPKLLEEAYSKLGSRISSVSNLIEIYLDKLSGLDDCEELLQGIIDGMPLYEDVNEQYFSNASEKIRKKVQHIQYPIQLKDYYKQD
jgi:hypothetical protein